MNKHHPPRTWIRRPMVVNSKVTSVPRRRTLSLVGRGNVLQEKCLSVGNFACIFALWKGRLWHKIDAIELSCLVEIKRWTKLPFQGSKTLIPLFLWQMSRQVNWLVNCQLLITCGPPFAISPVPLYFVKVLCKIEIEKNDYLHPPRYSRVNWIK